MLVIGREVGSAEERAAVGQKEHRHGPAAVSGDRLHRLHINAVEVGPLFAVDFDVHEILVHEARGLLILEGLVCHDVTPVACGVADAQEDRLVVTLRLLESLGSPRVPVDRICGVLEEVGAGFVRETVRHVLMSRNLCARNHG